MLAGLRSIIDYLNLSLNVFSHHHFIKSQLCLLLLLLHFERLMNSLSINWIIKMRLYLGYRRDTSNTHNEPSAQHTWATQVFVGFSKSQSTFMNIDRFNMEIDCKRLCIDKSRSEKRTKCSCIWTNVSM